MVNQVPGNRKNPGCLVPLCHLVEELDDVREVHVAVEDDVAVGLDQTKSYEEEELGRRDFFRRPYRLPHPVDVVVAELALEVQEEPSVAEIKVGEVSILLDLVVKGAVEDLHERPHVGEVLVHLVARGEVLDHPGHEGLEAGEDDHLIVKDDQQGGHEVAHALHVADLQVVPHVGRNLRNVIEAHLEFSTRYAAFSKLATFRSFSRLAVVK